MQDIIIIGGGIAGLSVGGRLSTEANVTLLEAEENLGYHTSSRSAAAFIEDYGNETIRELNRGSKAYLQGKEVDVLLKGKGKKDNQFRGATKWMQTAIFESNKNEIKSKVKLKINSAFDNCLMGELI